MLTTIKKDLFGRDPSEMTDKEKGKVSRTLTILEIEEALDMAYYLGKKSNVTDA